MAEDGYQTVLERRLNSDCKRTTRFVHQFLTEDLGRRKRRLLFQRKSYLWQKASFPCSDPAFGKHHVFVHYTTKDVTKSTATHASGTASYVIQNQRFPRIAIQQSVPRN